MPKKSEQFKHSFEAGYAAGKVDLAEAWLKENQENGVEQFELDPHDLDTIAMGIGLLMLYAADIQTIAATMDTQQKLGVTEKVLGWLHLICDPPGQFSGKITLHETTPNPRLELGRWRSYDPVTGDEWKSDSVPGAGNAENQGLDDEIPF